MLTNENMRYKCLALSYFIILGNHTQVLHKCNAVPDVLQSNVRIAKYMELIM